jgi:phosphatidylinositol glycan class C protein
MFFVPESTASQVDAFPSDPLRRRHWRRILYETQPFPDNFFDGRKFFDQLDLTLNDNMAGVSFTAVIVGASVVVQQLTVVAIFLTTYRYIVQFDVSANSLVIFDLVLLTMGYVIQRSLDKNAFSSISWKIAFHAIFLFGVCLRVAAPALKTLTSSFSEDTVHALAIASSTLHLASFDYGHAAVGETSGSGFFSGALSLNAAMITAVLLASRLSNIEIVFSFMLLAVILFSFLPSLSRLLRLLSIPLHLVFTTAKCLFAGAQLFYLDFTLFIIYILLVFFIWAVCPFWLTRMHVYKRALKGPWDIASVR